MLDGVVPIGGDAAGTSGLAVDETGAGDGALLDAYSRAVAAAVDRVAPAVVHLQGRQRDRTEADAASEAPVGAGEAGQERPERRLTSYCDGPRHRSGHGRVRLRRRPS